MKNGLLFITVVFFLQSSILVSQDIYNDKPSNYYELKIGGEINRGVPSIGFGKNFYLSNHISLSTELVVIGTPFLSGTFRVNFPIGTKLQIAPHAGFGLTPVGLPFTETGIIGINFSYSISRNLKLFIEPRIYFINSNVLSLGSGILKIDDINKTTPFIITLGVGL